MTTVPNRLTNPALPRIARRAQSSQGIHLFSRGVQCLWVFVTLITVASELLPIAPMPLVLFWLYYVLKVVSFCLLGVLVPLAFRSLNGIGRGMALALLSASLIEVFQGTMYNGHLFHWHELVGKLAIIVLGFGYALELRYERKMSVGSFEFDLLADR